MEARNSKATAWTRSLCGIFRICRPSMSTIGFETLTVSILRVLVVPQLIYWKGRENEKGLFKTYKTRVKKTRGLKWHARLHPNAWRQIKLERAVRWPLSEYCTHKSARGWLIARKPAQLNSSLSCGCRSRAGPTSVGNNRSLLRQLSYRPPTNTTLFAL
jgi:hypothetical protein